MVDGVHVGARFADLPRRGLYGAGPGPCLAVPALFEGRRPAIAALRAGDLRRSSERSMTQRRNARTRRHGLAADLGHPDRRPLLDRLLDGLRAGGRDPQPVRQDSKTDRRVRQGVPGLVFQSVNPFLIFALAPVFSILWLADRSDPVPPDLVGEDGPWPDLARPRIRGDVPGR